MEKMRRPSVCIIMLNWNGLEETRACLTSLLHARIPNTRILLIDNNSSHNEAGILQKEFDKMIEIYKLDKNYGFSGGVNYGIDVAKKYNPDFYLLLNNDTQVDKNFLFHLINTAESNKKIGIVSPLIYDYYNHKKILFAGGDFDWILVKFFHKKDIPNVTRQENFITGCSMLIKKDVIQKIGSFDNRFFAYFEDAAFCLTARRAGFICVCEPKAKIFHIEGASSEQAGSFRTYLVSRNRIIFVRNYTNMLFQIYFHIFNACKLIVVLSYFAITHQNKRIHPFYKGYIDGYLSDGGAPRL